MCFCVAFAKYIVILYGVLCFFCVIGVCVCVACGFFHVFVGVVCVCCVVMHRVALCVAFVCVCSLC